MNARRLAKSFLLTGVGLLFSMIYSPSAQANFLKPLLPQLAAWSIEWAEENADHERPATLFERLVIAIDPPAGTIFNGRITLHYDSTKLSIEEFGWFGAWGINPSLPAPEVSDVGRLALNTPIILQAPNPGLSLSVDTSTSGTIITNFDWGSNGFVQTDEQANIFGVSFVVLNPEAWSGAAFTNFGTGDLSEPGGLGNNFMTCLPNGLLVPTFCGDQPHGDIRLVPTPEPATFLFLATGLVGLLGYGWRRRKKTA
jgi:hypothetical protein